MTPEPNSEMLILAREVRGLTQAQLAEVSGIDQGSLSRYEGALKTVPDYDLRRIADALRFPVKFFLQEGRRYGVDTGEIFHRKRNSMPSGQLKRIHAQLNIFRLNVERLLDQIQSPQYYDLPQYDVREFDGDIEHIASLVRAAWKMPSGAVQNLMQRLEAAFCFIHVVDFRTHLIDETMQWCEPMRPVILVNERAPGDRLRFTQAHVLGHLVMHHNREPYIAMELEADKFAAAFLMPAADIEPDFDRLSLERLIQLKPYWQVSMQALINRAYELGRINEGRRKTLYQMLSREGYIRNEPFPIPAERPKSFKKLVQLYRERRHYTIDDVAELAGISANDFLEWYLPDEIPPLRLVVSNTRNNAASNRNSSQPKARKVDDKRGLPQDTDDERKATR